MPALTDAQVRAIFSEELDAALARLLGPAAAPAQPRAGGATTAARTTTKSSRKTKSNGFYEAVIKARVPCAYGVRKCGSFSPKGVGQWQHSTCPKGKAEMLANQRPAPVIER